MTTYYWNDWYSGWGWFLWYGLVILLFASVGNWGYTYRAHRKFDGPRKDAIDILNERFAKGEIKTDEYRQMKAEIISASTSLKSQNFSARANPVSS